MAYDKESERPAEAQLGSGRAGLAAGHVAAPLGHLADGQEGQHPVPLSFQPGGWDWGRAGPFKRKLLHCINLHCLSTIRLPAPGNWDLTPVAV